ncbi:MAG: hypothetical protein QXM02_00510 [Thermoproteota archaeon]
MLNGGEIGASIAVYTVLLTRVPVLYLHRKVMLFTREEVVPVVSFILGTLRTTHPIV